MKIYQVIHLFDVDGGIGDAVKKEEIIATFSNKNVAEDFVKKYNNPHIYDTPYAALYCGRLIIKDIEVLDNDSAKIFVESFDSKNLEKGRM